MAAEERLDMFQLQNAYSPMFDPGSIPAGQRSEFMKHAMYETFPTALVVVLHFLTFGLFTVIYHGLKHSQLPIVRYDDFSAGKAIGFLFIPFFNLYWVFVFWLRLADRINFQFRLRERIGGVSKGLIITTLVLGFIPYVGLLISFPILYPIVAGQVQSACNTLALMRAEEEQQ